MIIKIIPFLVILIFFIPGKGFTKGKTYKARPALLQVSVESDDKGILVDLVKAWGKAAGNTIIIHAYPFKRALDNVISGQADFHLPLHQKSQPE